MQTSRNFKFQIVKMLHIRSTNVKYPCNHCDYKATKKGNLLTHIKSKHEGVRFPCDQCDYKATWKRYLLDNIN